MSGTLYVVATPIGNLGDLTPRAREVLGSVALIAAEDTRHTKQLLDAYDISTPRTPLHEHNEARRSSELIAMLEQGKSIALVADAGTPLISDPGFDLVAAARRAGVPIVAVPGACAAIAALSIAGLPTDRFVFEGFLPARPAARRGRLEQLANEARTMVFYEAPHRLAEVLADMVAAFGAERAASVSRELTKRFETTYNDTLARLAEAAQRDPDMARGELVLVVGGNTAPAAALGLDTNRILRALLDELPPSQAARIAAHLTGAKRADLYDAALALATNKRPE